MKTITCESCIHSKDDGRLVARGGSLKCWWCGDKAPLPDNYRPKEEIKAKKGPFPKRHDLRGCQCCAFTKDLKVVPVKGYSGQVELCSACRIDFDHQLGEVPSII